jgi:hypothetical protein
MQANMTYRITGARHDNGQYLGGKKEESIM